VTVDIEQQIFSGLATREDLAKAFGKSTKTIKRWEAEGLPVLKRGYLRLYDPQQVHRWLCGELGERAPGQRKKRV
jgi:phage terminase Nu1 subunit (DNA packaging protein)